MREKKIPARRKQLQRRSPKQTTLMSSCPGEMILNFLGRTLAGNALMCQLEVPLFAISPRKPVNNWRGFEN